MSQQMIGEIRMFGGNFAPRNWAYCNGQLLSINQNQALFSILGTTYGGDGRTTFGLPDLRGRTAIGQGQGPGLTNRPLGQRLGTTTNTLTFNNLPSHTHTLTTDTTVTKAYIQVSDATADENSPDGNYLTEVSSVQLYQGNLAANQFLGGSMSAASGQTGMTGAQQPINNRQPYLTVHYIIALFGIFPSRT